VQGKVADFGIADIFQLIASQGKSGILRISGDRREILFRFCEGCIVDVVPDRRIRPPESMLGQMLVDAGYLSDVDLRRALAQQARGGKRLGELLVDEGLVSSATLSRYLNLQVKEAIFFALRITEGEYSFESLAVRPPPWMTEPIRPDILLMEGMQFLDEYPVYREKFPRGKFVVRRVPGAVPDPGVLSAEERLLWENLDFSPDPWRVCRKACITWFEGIRGLARLLERGCITVAPMESGEADAARAAREEERRRMRAARVRAASWGLALLVAAWGIYRGLLSREAAPAFSAWVRFFLSGG